MSHVRKQIRDAFVATLANATAAGIKVYGNRVLKTPASLCPIINVRTPGEIITGRVIHVGGMVEREVAVDVDLFVAVTADADDAIDALASQVETAVLAGGLMGLPQAVINYTGAAIEFDDVGSGEVAYARLRYTVRTMTSGPETFA